MLISSFMGELQIKKRKTKVFMNSLIFVTNLHKKNLITWAGDLFETDVIQCDSAVISRSLDDESLYICKDESRTKM